MAEGPVFDWLLNAEIVLYPKFSSVIDAFNHPKGWVLLKTEIIFDKTVFNVSIIKAKSYFGEELLCECEMKIVVDNS